MSWLKRILGTNPNVPCAIHGIVNCPTCFELQSDKIIRKVEQDVKNLKLKPVKKKGNDTKNSS